ncbi:hypothetical protein SKAU_G00299420 [Synaphobranchus kaupii]|uniref:Interleukin-2 receptor subunit beta N-terminal domain-containing protein n=1 Tax=Synaphobranchus kaupii TaxID=118154 RepID=A0A9Q1IMV8_SYNKA|nr:hypothetical protein SKAU_G00299420 [Synaphobranchus kaupii]
MEVSWPARLLLLLAMQILPCHSLKGLTCVHDLVNNISCMWNSSGTHPNVPCVLHGELQQARKHKNSCNLQPMEDQDTLWSCHLVFENVQISVLDTVPIRLKCGNYNVGPDDYMLNISILSSTVKMQPPTIPLISKSNVSWSLGTTGIISYYYFQLQFKRSEQPWEKVNFADVKQMSVELPEDSLEMGRLYEARVRVKPSESEVHPLKWVWSSWSPTASWRSEVGRPPEREKPRSGPELQLFLGLAVAVVALLVLISWKYNRDGWVYRLKLPHVPNPSTYFHALNSDHGGNFQKWLSPIFAPESFEVHRSFEDISAVELFKAKDVTVLHESDPAEWSDSSSKSLSSNNVDACPEYVSYKPGEVHSGEEGSGQGVELEATPLQISCSYEQLGGESRQPDPGCRERNEEEEEEEDEEEEEEEGEIEDGPKEMDTLPPLTILPFSLPGHVTPSPFPLPPHLPSIPLLPFPFRDFDSATAPGSSNASGPFEGALGRSPFAEIEPSSDGYLSVQSALLNNSL